MTRRIVVLASGEGSNLQAIIDACATGALPAKVVAVVSNRPGIGALRRATEAGITAVHVGADPSGAETRPEYDARLADVVSGFDPDRIVCAGFMRILSMSFLGWFPEMVINLHPALPGQLPGVNAIPRAFAEFQQGARDHTGVMVHLVPDAGVDDGPVLATCVVDICAADTLETLTQRVHLAEHRLLVETLAALCRTGATV